MKRLKIIIPHTKRYILSLLYDKFPRFSVDMLDHDKPIVFTASFEDDRDMVGDLAWLKRIGLEYLDEQMEREQIISAFFNDMLIEWMDVRKVRFADGYATQPDYFKIRLTMDGLVITLQLPNNWTPPKIV